MDINNLFCIGFPITLMMMRLTNWKFFHWHSKKMFLALFLFAAISTSIFYLLSFEPLFLLTWFGYFTVVPLSCFGGSKLADKAVPDDNSAPNSTDAVLSLLGGSIHIAMGIATLLFTSSAKGTVLLQNSDSRITIISKTLFCILSVQYLTLNAVWKQIIEWRKRKY